MNNEELSKHAQQIDSYQVGFQPIIRAYMQKLGLIELIDQAVGGQMEVKPGIIVAGMIQDTLTGRSPLYHLKNFFENQDTELILGEAVDSSVFADHNVGRVLDRIKEAGPSRIFGEIARRAAVVYKLDTTSGHWDSTSVSVWGNYGAIQEEEEEKSGEEGKTLNLTHGYSKDHRPDLKQFMISMLCVEHNIPMIGETHDGNSSDKTLNQKLLTRINKNLAENGLAEGAFTYVADSAMVTKENLAFFAPTSGMPPMYFVTRLPFTYDETRRVVTEAVSANLWQDIGVLAKTKSTGQRSCASYRAHETEVELYGKSYRAIVIHSSSHDKRRQKRIDKEIVQAKQALLDSIDQPLKAEFFCQADADAALANLMSLSMPLHNLDAKVEEDITFAPGRPSKEGEKKIAKHCWRIRAEITEKIEAIQKKRDEAGCFVLLSNRPKDGSDAQTAKDLLQTYKAQDGIERNFSFLKDPLIVNDLFLKKPERIEALGMVLLICLLIWNLMQRQMREHLEKHQSKLEGWDKRPTQRPTSYMMTTKFKYIHIFKVGQSRVLKKPLSSVQKDYLTALGLTENIFICARAP